VAEAAVVGRPHEIKGQAVVAFVSLKTGIEGTDNLLKEVRNHVGKVIGAIAKPDDVYFTPALPKTRSGKIMRRLLKELVATGKVTGNMTTLEDVGVVKSLEKLVKKK
jgi:acetyl-CoA synthetase